MAISLIALAANVYGARLLPHWQNIVFVVHIAAYFAVLAPVWVNAPQVESTQVWSDFENSGGWSSMSLAILIGQMPGITAQVGIDTVCDKNSSRLLVQSSARHGMISTHHDTYVYMANAKSGRAHVRRGQRRCKDHPQGHDDHVCHQRVLDVGHVDYHGIPHSRYCQGTGRPHDLSRRIGAEIGHVAPVAQRGARCHHVVAHVRQPFVPGRGQSRFVCFRPRPGPPVVEMDFARGQNPRYPHERLHRVGWLEHPSQPDVHWQPGRVLCHYVAMHRSVAAMLLSKHWLHAVSTTLPSRNFAVRSLLPGQIRGADQCLGRCLFAVGVLLVFLATSISRDGRRFQLVFAHICICSLHCDDILCYHRSTQLSWTCGARRGSQKAPIVRERMANPWRWRLRNERHHRVHCRSRRIYVYTYNILYKLLGCQGIRQSETPSDWKAGVVGETMKLSCSFAKECWHVHACGVDCARVVCKWGLVDPPPRAAMWRLAATQMVTTPDAIQTAKQKPHQ